MQIAPFQKPRPLLPEGKDVGFIHIEGARVGAKSYPFIG